ncbi:MAG: hypothetical protein LBF58_08975 [Deltaproteobacteria bacterium]|jgi:tetratricopeptide (TPR) repeat protein|nr:hypothetical protein [Deltaproteobacteria bacterium]
MVDLTTLGPGALINELDETLDVIYSLAGSLGLGITPAGDYKVKLEKEDSETHRKRAQLALAQVKVRDLVEAIGNSGEARRQEPVNLATTMGKLINVYSLMELIDESRTYFDILRPLIKANGSHWQVAACLNLIVIGYLDDGRYIHASSLYYEMLKLSNIDEMVHGLVRSAFNLISRFVMCQQLARAHKIYNTMRLYCPIKPDLSLVGSGRPGGGERAGWQKPLGLTLVRPARGGEGQRGPGPDEFGDALDYEDANLVRGQAAINLLSGYALTGQANKALEVYKTITEYDDPEEYVTIKSMAAVNLIRAYIQSHRWPDAFHYYKELIGLRKKSDNSILVAKAAVELIGFAGKKNLSDAEYICSSLEGLSQEESFTLERCRAVGNLIFIYGDFNEMEKAQRLYDSLDSFGDSLDILAVRAKSTVNLMSDYCSLKRLDMAEDLYGRLMTFGDHATLAPSKIQGAHNLMAGYLKSNQAKKAEELFENLAQYANTPNIAILKARALFSLLAYQIHKKDLEKTIRLYEVFDELGDTEDVLLERGKALVNMVTFIGGLGLTTLAKRHYLEFHDKAVTHMNNKKSMFDEDFDVDALFEDNEELARMSNYPIGGFSEYIGQYIEFENDAYQLGNSVDTDFEPNIVEVESISSLLAKASFNIILDFIEAGNFAQAETLYQTMFSLDLNNHAVALDVFQAGYLIVSTAAPVGRWPLTMRVFESFERLPKTQSLNHQRCLVAINILNNNAQRKLHISKTVYDILMGIQPKGPFGDYIARAALDTIANLTQAARYNEALVVYKSMAELGKGMKVMEKRAQAAYCLMKAYESMGWLSEAKKLYQSMSALGDYPKVTKLRLKAAKALAGLMRSSGLKEAAEQLHEDTCGFKRFKKDELESGEAKEGKARKTIR